MRTLSSAAALVSMFVISAASNANILTPPTTGQLPDVFAGCSGCTLLASTDSGIVTSTFNGLVLSIDLRSAVYSDPGNTFGAGHLDFMYQVTNEQSSTDSVDRITATNFAGFQTDAGYTLAGTTLPGGLFVNGSVPPALLDRKTASTVGFGFAVSPLSGLVGPGEASTVLIIQTDALLFTIGQATVLDSNAITVNTLGPGPTSVPEPATLSLLGLGLAGVGLLRRRKKH